MASGRHILALNTPTRRGFTLVELLVAATLALTVMGSVATLFGLFGRSFSDSQSIIDMSARMRAAGAKLRDDLEGLTTSPQPWIRPDANGGYFEIIEGPLTDNSAAHGTSTVLADTDDALMLTTTSINEPFKGALAGALGLESPTAEVAWFCKPSGVAVDGSLLRNLYRRQLLVCATPGTGSFQNTHTAPFTSWDAFYMGNDLSCRRQGATLIANSLADLSKRENRFLHNPTGGIGASVFPYPAVIGPTAAATNGDILTGTRIGEDLVLPNVIAFDIQVLDSQRLTAASSYIDLGSGLPSTSPLASAPNGRSRLTVPTYDTWSSHYENNGVDEDGALGIDQGTNDTDDNGNDVKDEQQEFETAPPYSVPLHGLRVRIRCYEPTSRQIRQITIIHSFIN